MIPSVFEENSMVFSKVADTFIDGIRLVNFKGKDYIIGNLALKEGNAPHKLINSSPDDIDYQLLGLTAMLIASLGSYSKLVVTIGFPNTTYPLYKKDAGTFFQGNHLTHTAMCRRFNFTILKCLNRYIAFDCLRLQNINNIF